MQATYQKAMRQRFGESHSSGVYDITTYQRLEQTTSEAENPNFAMSIVSRPTFRGSSAHNLLPTTSRARILAKGAG